MSGRGGPQGTSPHLYRFITPHRMRNKSERLCASRAGRTKEVKGFEEMRSSQQLFVLGRDAWLRWTDGPRCIRTNDIIFYRSNMLRRRQRQH
ncbi:unnamed protein product [Gadus morhua 'NCC']